MLRDRREGRRGEEKERDTQRWRHWLSEKLAIGERPCHGQKEITPDRHVTLVAHKDYPPAEHHTTPSVLSGSASHFVGIVCSRGRW